MLHDALSLIGWNLALIGLVMLGLWGLAVRLKDVSFIDGVWGLGMALLAVVSWFRTDGDDLRRGLLVVICVAWGARLGWRLLLRWRRQGPGRRYEALMERATSKDRPWARQALLLVFLPQGVLLWLTCLPVQLGQIASGPSVGVMGWIGAALALTGLAIETVADAQLDRFSGDPANRRKVLDTGLWRYSRHPNYFGDACVWWGLWLVAAETLPGLFAVVGPIFLTFTLTRWSGVPLIEAAMNTRRPGYGDYVRRTSSFIPWPPRRLG